jgi:hypothetical protein
MEINVMEQNGMQLAILTAIRQTICSDNKNWMHTFSKPHIFHFLLPVVAKCRVFCRSMVFGVSLLYFAETITIEELCTTNPNLKNMP